MIGEKFMRINNKMINNILLIIIIVLIIFFTKNFILYIKEGNELFHFLKENKIFIPLLISLLLNMWRLAIKYEI